MKKPLFKTIALLAAAFSFFVGSPIGVKGSAETENFTQTGVETVADGGETGNPENPEIPENSENESASLAKLRVRRCDFTMVVGERAFYLPKFDATSADGTDISHLVTITDSKESEIDLTRGTIILKEAGEHVITYSVVDPATNETLFRSFTITKQREIFNYNNLSGELFENAAAEDQYCVSINSGQGISRFNMAVSDTYYAEVYFNASETVQFKAGLAHVVRTNFDKGVNSNLWWASMVDVENGMSHQTYKDADWKLQAINGTDTVTELVAGEGFKYAVARYGTTLYAFINDVLVSTYECSELNGVLTAPGIFTAATKNGDYYSTGGVKISSIDYYSGSKALLKISALTGEEIKTEVKVDVGGAGWGGFDTPYIP